MLDGPFGQSQQKESTLKNVILFGAGSSYGSNHVLPDSPPLGGMLFSRLAKAYPSTWGSLPQEFRSDFVDFEKGMLKVMNSGQHWISSLMQTMALFFCSFKIDCTGEDLYSLFIRCIERNGNISNTLFSTLNYECLLEQAVALNRIPINYDHNLRSGRLANIWKIHGSCNFIPNPEEITMRRGASYAWGVTLNTKIVPSELDDVVAWINGDNALYPAMCMFTLNKPSQVSPAIFAEYQEKWRNLVDKADRVFVIGVRPNRQDQHIWDSLLKTKANLYFVGGRNEYDSFVGDRGNLETIFLGPTFNETYLDISKICV